MKLLMALDSRWANQAAVGLLDPHSGDWSSFQVIDVPEPFNRRGFRGMSVVDDHTIYAVNSAALYRMHLNLDDRSSPFVTIEQTIRRPEWEVGQRAAADLHHVFYQPERETFLVANSAMDSIDEVSPGGDLISRRYLWDVSSDMAKLALERRTDASTHDLAHVNHISTHGGFTYLTLGNLNGSRVGCVMRLETGQIVLDGLRFPHDGVFAGDDLYITNSDTSELLVWRGVGDMDLRGRSPEAVIAIPIRHEAWRESFQWVRGVAVTREHVVVGVTQWKNTDEAHPQIPPRLVFFKRDDLTFEGEIFLPRVEGFPSPCIYSIHVLEESRDEAIPEGVWQRAIDDPPPSEVVDDQRIAVEEPSDLTLLLVTARERSQRLMEQLGAQRAQAKEAMQRSRDQNAVLRERLERSKQQGATYRARLESSQARLAATQDRLATANARLQAIWRTRWWRLGHAIRRVLRRPGGFVRFPVDAAKALFGRRSTVVTGSSEPAPAAQTSSWVAPAAAAPSTLGSRWLRGYTRRPRSTAQLTVASILDDMSHACFAPECTLQTIRPDNWRAVLEEQRPHFLLVESAWRGNRGAWQYKIGTYAYPGSIGLPDLSALIDWCRSNEIPTVFWNKEDPIHFDRFKEAARLFDHVFTTDASSGPRYARLPGLRAKTIDALPFAAQPMLHNPIASSERLAQPCFAGTYYRTRHQQRRTELEMLLDASIPFGLVIYDRTWDDTSGEFGFPERFRPYIRGGLPYDAMVDEYKRYKVFLNINSVTDSPTMLSRRVFELLACGTPVVSTPTPAIEAMLGDVVPTVETPDETTAALRLLLEDDETWRAKSEAGIRTVMREHTYGRRIAQIATTGGYDVVADENERIAAIAIIDDQEQIDRLVETLSRQTSPPNEVVLGTCDVHVPDAAIGAIRAAIGSDEIRVIEVDRDAGAPAYRTIAGQATTPWVWIVGDGHRYEETFLQDTLACARFSRADVIGRADGAVHRFTDAVDPKASIARREVVLARGWPDDEGAARLQMPGWFREGTRIYAAGTLRG